MSASRTLHRDIPVLKYGRAASLWPGSSPSTWGRTSERPAARSVIPHSYFCAGLPGTVPAAISAAELIPHFDLAKLPRQRVVLGPEDFAWLV